MQFMYICKMSTWQTLKALQLWKGSILSNPFLEVYVQEQNPHVH